MQTQHGKSLSGIGLKDPSPPWASAGQVQVQPIKQALYCLKMLTKASSLKSLHL